MESSVRYVQLPGAGQKPALCFRGSKSAYAVINQGGRVRSVEIDLKDYDKAVHVKSTANGGDDYSPVAFREAVLRIIQRAGSSVTQRAQLLLDKGAYLKSDDALPEEEPMMPPKDEEDGQTNLADGDEETRPALGGSPLGEGKPKVRKLPKRINREGKAEDAPPRKPTFESGKSVGRIGTGIAVRSPRQADPARKPAPILPLPRKAAESAKKTTGAKASRGTGGKTLVSILAAEAGIAQQPCRVKLRAAGFRAPYEEKNINDYRKALGLATKGKK